MDAVWAVLTKPAQAMPVQEEEPIDLPPEHRDFVVNYMVEKDFCRDPVGLKGLFACGLAVIGRVRAQFKLIDRAREKS